MSPVPTGSISFSRPEMKKTMPIIRALILRMILIDSLDFFENKLRRQHSPVLVRAVDDNKSAVHPRLLDVDVPHPLLEGDVRLVDILGTAKVSPVAVRLAVLRKAALHKAERHVEEDVQVRLRDAEVLILRLEDPLAQLLRLGGIGELCALVGDVGIDI